MHSFEECYKKTRDQFRSLKFIQEQTGTPFADGLGKVFASSSGPSSRHAGSLDGLRTEIATAKVKNAKSEGEVLVAGCHDSKAKGMDKIFGKMETGLNDRVAAVKMARHLQLMKLRGGQSVWFFSPPVAYTEWVYDEFDGMSKSGLETWASEADETYSDADKTALANATQTAMSYVMKCMAELGSPTDATKDVIKRWFCAADATDKDVKVVAKTLAKGYRKMAKVLNGSHLILSDEPKDRNSGGWKDYAFVYKSEKMDVIYVQSATISAALGGRGWLAALTLVHELSHREMSTDDHRYDTTGNLSPMATGGLTTRQAIENADNWGYFATDLAGGLPASNRLTVTGIAA